MVLVPVAGGANLGPFLSMKVQYAGQEVDAALSAELLRQSLQTAF